MDRIVPLFNEVLCD